MEALEDRYMSFDMNVKRLVLNYKSHKNLFIAFDFDDTVFDYCKRGDKYPKIESLLRFLKSNGFTLILFTSREGYKLDKSIKYCKNRGYEPNFVNENPIMKTRKPYYNILLDDKAGLNESYEILVKTLNLVGLDYKY